MLIKKRRGRVQRLLYVLLQLQNNCNKWKYKWRILRRILDLSVQGECTGAQKVPHYISVCVCMWVFVIDLHSFSNDDHAHYPTLRVIICLLLYIWHSQQFWHFYWFWCWYIRYTVRGIRCRCWWRGQRWMGEHGPWRSRRQWRSRGWSNGIRA